MNRPPGAVRAPGPKSAERAAQDRWLIGGLVVLVVVPLAFPAWLVGVALLRLGWVRRRWLLGVAGALVLVDVARFGWDLGAVAHEHFRLYLALRPGLEGAIGAASPHPFRGLGPGVLWSGLAGFAWLSVPAGLVLACVVKGSEKSGPEWTPEATAARERAEDSALATARRVAAIPPDGDGMAPLGAVLSGDLGWRVTARKTEWLRLPEETLVLPRVLAGQPGFGKTHSFLRMVYLYARLGFQVVFVDGKGTDPTLPERVLSNFMQGWAASERGHQHPEVLVYPDEPMTMWRGSPRDVVQKVLGVWTFAEQHQFFESVAENALSLAIEVPAAERVVSSEQLLGRLSRAELTRLHAKFGTDESRATLRDILDVKQWGLAGFALRLRSLLRSVGPTLDGDIGFEDVDLAMLTVPSGLKRRDASAIMRVLLEEFGLYASGRKGARPCLLVFDEFSALQGGRATATDLIERLRSTDTEVMLGVQSFEGLGGGGPGSIGEALRILNACSGGLMLYRTPSPDNFVRLGGSVQVPATSLNVADGELTDRGMVRSEGRFRVDPDVVRQLTPGECFYIVGGRAARLYVATTKVDDWAARWARDRILAARESDQATLEGAG